MKVTLLHYTPLLVAMHAIRTCHNSFDKSDTEDYIAEWSEDVGWHLMKDISKEDFAKKYPQDPNPLEKFPEVGPKDKELINRVGNKMKHGSTLEHLVYSFYIQGISRACLQELARHRMASLSVKSTRYTLKELKDEEPFITERDTYTTNAIERVSKYIVLTGNEEVDYFSIMALNNLRRLLYLNYSNDIAKYALPECYKTELIWTINARSLQNFLTLRTDKSALWEIRDLAKEIYNALPESHKYIFEEYLKYNSN